MFYQILSNKQNVDGIQEEQILFLLRQIHSIQERSNFIFKKRIVLQLNVWKDDFNKVCFAITSNMKEHQLEKLLSDTFGSLAVRTIKEVPKATKYGKRMGARNKVYCFENDNILVGVVKAIPKGVIMVLHISRALEPILIKLKQEEKNLINKKKYLNDNDVKERNKDLKIKQEYANYMFKIDITVSAIDSAYKNNVYNFCKKLRLLSEGRFNALKIKLLSNGKLSDTVKMNHKSKIFMTDKEAVQMFNVPTIEDVGNVVYAAEEEINPEDFSEGVKVGIYTMPDGSKHEIRIPLEVLTKHLFLCGMTGGGKSAALIGMLDDLIQTYKMDIGFTIIDPKQTTLIKLVNHLLYFESMGIPIDWNKVHYIDLVDPQYVPGLNLLNIPTQHTDPDKFIENTMTTFKGVYNNGDTPRMDRMIRMVVGTLHLEQGRTNTIIDAYNLLTNGKRQQQAQRRLGKGYYERVYKNFWDDPPKKGELESIMNRLNMFQTTQMQRLYGLPKFDLKIREWMDDGHIVLINTKGLDEEKTRLNVGHILNQYYLVGIERPTAGAKPHLLVFDEGKQTQLPILYEKMFPILREFNIPNIFTTQSIVSIKKEVANEIKENFTTFISGRLGSDGAPKLSAMMSHRIEAKDFQDLSDLYLYVSTTNTKKSGFQTMKVKVEPPYWYVKDSRTNRYRVAEFHDEKRRKIEEGIAGNEAMQKIMKLQKRDWLHKSEVDKLLEERYPAFESSASDSNGKDSHSSFFNGLLDE